MFRVLEESKQILIATFSSMTQKVALISDCWETFVGIEEYKGESSS